MGIKDFLRNQACALFEVARRCRFPEEKAQIEALAKDIMAEVNQMEGDTLLYLCPVTGLRVQGWIDGDKGAADNAYEGIRCTACGQLHLVNRAGKVLAGG